MERLREREREKHTISAINIMVYNSAKKTPTRPTRLKWTRRMCQNCVAFLCELNGIKRQSYYRKKLTFQLCQQQCIRSIRIDKTKKSP